MTCYADEMRLHLIVISLVLLSLGQSPAVCAQEATPFAQSTLRVTLDIRDEPIREVLEELARLAGLNLVLSANVGGNVTASFDSVPIDEAFRSLLAAGDLGWCVEGGVLSVHQ